MDSILLTVDPAHYTLNSKSGRYLVRRDGEILLSSARFLFFEGCRELLRRGIDPKTPVAFRHAASSTISMRSTVGHGATRTVSEPDRFPMRIVPYVAFERQAPDAS